jgi:hypothetical protein
MRPLDTPDDFYQVRRNAPLKDVITLDAFQVFVVSHSPPRYAYVGTILGAFVGVFSKRSNRQSANAMVSAASIMARSPPRGHQSFQALSLNKRSQISHRVQYESNIHP